MANKWYYKHGVTVPNGGTVKAPDDDVVGSVVYVDQNHPNASDTAPNAGCANVPFVTLNAASLIASTIIVAKGEYIFNESGQPIIISDTLFGAVINLGTAAGCRPWVTRGVLKTLNAINIANTQPFNTIIQAPNIRAEGYVIYNNCLLLTNSYASLYNNNVHISINKLSTKGLHYNCVPPTQTSATGFYNNVFWLGTLNLNALTSDLNTICPLIGTIYPTENDAIAKVETDLGLAANTLKNNGFRLLNPHFINMSKGNFNIDFLNYDCTEILALRDSWDWIINRGVRCEYPLDFVGAVGAGFGEEPNLSDGFGGALYSRNINSSGVITNTAYDTVLVSKKYVLPQAYTLENINFFDKLISTAFELNATENDGTDTPNCYTFYLIGVKTGTLESVFNSSNNTFSYSTGVLTCDFPRFMWNRSTQLNKDDNTIYGQIENGTFDLDYMRNIFKAGVKEFRIIAVKKGV